MKESLLSKQELQDVLTILEKEHNGAKCGLDYDSPIYLTVALILAAQCTDQRVNKITPIFFEKFKDVYGIAKAEIKEIETIIRSCGFYNNKAKNISLTAKKIVSDFNGQVPSTMEELTSLYGIGRKSANIILQECFRIVQGIAVDTHVSRTCYRIGITKETVPLKQEQELIKKVDLYYFDKLNHILVWHGRKYCDAKKPKCDSCPIFDQCLKKLEKRK